jgi:hypothetical protein
MTTVPVIDKNTKWVVIQVGEDGKALFVEPSPLRLKSGWVGDIVWHVFTPGWDLSFDNGVKFDPDTKFDGRPLPDAGRSGCWSTAAANMSRVKERFNYTINVMKNGTTAVLSGDPVVENEPPP